MNLTTKSQRNNAVAYPRLVHTMIRISNIDKSLDFYINALGMKELRRETHTKGKFTLVFLGYGDEASNTVLELTYNWYENKYQLGTAFGHIAIGVDDIYATCEKLESSGIVINRKPGPIAFDSDIEPKEIIAFIKDPDGYQIELIEVKQITAA